MALWATKRRFIYGGGFLSAVLLIVGFIFWQIIYTAPTCTDGLWNGDEKGVDCGGGCPNLCTVDTLTPVTLWSKTFKISGDVYTAVAYVQNPNINSSNPKANYKFTLYDENNEVIVTKEGETSIPKNKKFAIFETGIVLKNAVPKRTEFEFTKFSPWQKDFNTDPDVSLEYSPLVTPTTTPRITGKITNISTKTATQVELDVFVLDGKENVVAASRSFVDNLLKGTSQDFVFTWPKPFDLGVEVCANPLDVIVSLDRSGSMKSEGNNPPEPFTTVVNTARNFVKALDGDDKISVQSFGDNSRLENILSPNKDFSVLSINKLALSTSTLEQTNIYAGLLEAFNELKSDRSRKDSKKSIILLTDGVPTEPKSKGVPDYPAVAALNLSRDIKEYGIDIYTIGLGKSVSEEFLKSISSDDNHYFFAPTKETLAGIYDKIGSGLCPKKPNVITVIYRFF